MSKINDFNGVKQKIESCSSDFLNQAEKVAFRATESEMHWILDINNSQYNIVYSNDLIQVYQLGSEVTSFHPSRMDEFEKHVSSLTSNPVIHNNYEVIQSLTNSSNYYDFEITKNGTNLDVYYPNNAKVMAIVSDSKDVVYGIRYLDDTYTHIPISIQDGKLQIDNVSSSYVGSLDEVSKVTSQIGGVDKFDLSEKMLELKQERIEDIHNQLINSVSGIYNSADSVSFNVFRDYDFKLEIVNNSDEYSIVLNNESVEIYKNKEFVGHFELGELDKIKEIIPIENESSNANMYKFSSELIHNVYNYEISSHENFNHFTILCNNGLCIAGDINESNMVEYSVYIESDKGNIPVILNKDNIYLANDSEAMSFQSMYLGDFEEMVSRFNKLSLNEIKEVVESTESLKAETNELSVQEIHDKLMAATSYFYTHADGVTTQIDEDKGSIRIDYYLNSLDPPYEEQVNRYSFVLEDNIIKFYGDDQILGQWSVDKMYEMSKEIDMSCLGYTCSLEELPSSLTENACSYTVNVDMEDTYPQQFSIKYDNNLLLTGTFNKDGSVDYTLFIEDKTNDTSMLMNTPVIVEDGELCVVDNNYLAKSHVSSIDELGESISKVSGISNSQVEDILASSRISESIGFNIDEQSKVLEKLINATSEISSNSDFVIYNDEGNGCMKLTMSGRGSSNIFEEEAHRYEFSVRDGIIYGIGGVKEDIRQIELPVTEIDKLKDIVSDWSVIESKSSLNVPSISSNVGSCFIESIDSTDGKDMHTVSYISINFKNNMILNVSAGDSVTYELSIRENEATTKVSFVDGCIIASPEKVSASMEEVNDLIKTIGNMSVSEVNDAIIKGNSLDSNGPSSNAVEEALKDYDKESNGPICSKDDMINGFE